MPDKSAASLIFASVSGVTLTFVGSVFIIFPYGGKERSTKVDVCNVFYCKRKRYVYGAPMSETKPTRKINRSKPPAPRLKTYRMPDELIDRITRASVATGLKPSDIVRLSIDRGVDFLLGQLSKPATEEGES